MKQINVIANNTLESRLISMASKNGVNGYTSMQAQGSGLSGLQSGISDGDSNIFFLFILTDAQAETFLVDLKKVIDKGHRLKVLITDIEILL
ncbi:P-II family nitrogen regulator [Thiomicrorhabdus aquaedulcis]|uniref:P-II family nitrogen regulator n=1 Tax=Thiomicrorhabdus aquaedulcis TaxID=2211106 RepID=UPI000FD704C6|nr:hypothetical protein [Thiomicrorhabdus aquaedulcis]